MEDEAIKTAKRNVINQQIKKVKVGIDVNRFACSEIEEGKWFNKF